MRLQMGLRVVLAAPAAFAAAVVAQELTSFAVSRVLWASVGPQPWTFVVTRCAGAPVMAAAFVLTAYWVTPVRKDLGLAAAVGFLALWTGTLLLGAWEPRFAWPVLVMSLLGAGGGGLAAFWAHAHERVRIPGEAA